MLAMLETPLLAWLILFEPPTLRAVTGRVPVLGAAVR